MVICDRHSVIVNQDMVVALKFQIYDFNLTTGTLGSVASLLASTLYQGDHDRNHKLWNIVSTERYNICSVCRCCWDFTT